MRDTLIIALEAAWELDPVRLEGKLWEEVEKSDQMCYDFHSFKESVEQVSNQKRRMPYLCLFADFGY